MLQFLHEVELLNKSQIFDKFEDWVDGAGSSYHDNFVGSLAKSDNKPEMLEGKIVLNIFKRAETRPR